MIYFKLKYVIETQITEYVMNVTVKLTEQRRETESLGSADLHKFSILAPDHRCIWSTDDTKICKETEVLGDGLASHQRDECLQSAII